MVSAVTLRAARQYGGGAVRTRAKRFRALRSVLVPRSRVLSGGECDDDDNATAPPWRTRDFSFLADCLANRERGSHESRECHIECNRGNATCIVLTSPVFAFARSWLHATNESRFHDRSRITSDGELCAGRRRTVPQSLRAWRRSEFVIDWCSVVIRPTGWCCTSDSLGQREDPSCYLSLFIYLFFSRRRHHLSNLLIRRR